MFLGSTGNDFAVGGLIIDSNDNIWVSGRSDQHLCGTGIGLSHLLMVLPLFSIFIGQDDIVLIKLGGSDGVQLECSRMGTNQDDYPSFMALSDDSTLIIGGITFLFLKKDCFFKSDVKTIDIQTGLILIWGHLMGL